MENEKRLIDGDKLRGLKYEKTKFSDYREGCNRHYMHGIVCTSRGSGLDACSWI